MAEWYDEGFQEYYIESNDVPVEDILFGGQLDVDQRAQDLFMEAFFEKDEDAYQALVEYMWDVYGIDFEDAFSWDDFREWYDGAG